MKWILFVFCLQIFSLSASAALSCQRLWLRSSPLGQLVSVRFQGAPAKSPYVDLVYAGSYGGQRMGFLPNNPKTLYLFGKADLKSKKDPLSSPDFPRMTPQIGETCLPTAIAYIQKLFPLKDPHILERSDTERATWMAQFMTYNPLMIGDRTNRVQLSMAEAALTASGIEFHRAKEIDEMAKHVASGKIALIGVNVSTKKITMASVDGKNSQEVLVNSPEIQSRGAHAMVVTAFIDLGGPFTQYFVLVDPTSGESFVVSRWSMGSNYLEGFLIDSQLLPL